MMAISARKIVLPFVLLLSVARSFADQSQIDDATNQTSSSSSLEQILVESGSEQEMTVATIPPQSDGDVLEKLFKNYDDSLHPLSWQSAGKDDLSKAMNITVNMYIRHLKMDHDRYEIQLTLRQEWVDPRLNFGRFGKVANYINLPPDYDIWMPDTFFQNELSAVRHKIDTDNVMIRLEANGHVTYSTRLTLVVHCEQNFQAYPLDEQQCKLRLASYAHVQESVHYEWRSTNPIQKSPSTRTQKWLSDLDLVDAVPIDCPIQEIGPSKYSCLELALNFKRRVTMYMWVLYLPTILLVLISWLAFWLHTNSQVSRLAIGVSCLLLCIALIAHSSMEAPHTYFLKASDIWNMTVLSFCFLALLESAIVTSAARKYRQRAPIRYQEEILENDKLMLREETPYYSQLVEEQPKSSAKRIDFVARIAFPLLFLVFNIIYWIRYLTQYI